MDASRPLTTPSRRFGVNATRRVPAIGLTVALTVSLMGLTAPAISASAAVDGGTFASSFETGGTQASINTKYSDPVNVTGKRFGNGSLLGNVTSVTATAENTPNEGAANLADGLSATKWLAFVKTATVTYQLDAPAVVKQYKLTSADDAPGRDPKNWTIEGSNDGTNWLPVDSQSNQAFSARFATKTYEITNTVAYSRYRLNITANSGDGLTQLADWEILDGTNTPGTATPIITDIGNGPVSGPNIKPGVGFTGAKALRYAGTHLAEGAATSTNLLFDNVATPIGDDSQLSYKVFPVLGGNLSYPATYVAIDLLLDDGSLLSSHDDLVDAYGFGATARDQGTEKALYANQWNSVKVDISSLAGHSIDKVLFTYDNPAGTGETAFSGWVDDVAVGAATKIDDSSLTNFVDTRRGTNSSGGFSRGNNIPATAVPNGFNFFTPMTDATSQSWLYNYASSNNSANKPQLQAIGISHEPSPWMGDRAQLAVMPSLATGAPNATPASRALEFTHDKEIAQPELYSVDFTNGINASVTPTDHSGIYSFTFPEANSVGTVMVDRVAGDSKLSISPTGALTGWVENGSGLSAGSSRMFISGQFSVAPTASGMATGRTSATYGNFPLDESKKVELRIATSFISTAQASKNLDLEVTGKTFAETKQAAKAAWNDRLSVIEVDGASQAERVTLTSSLYRLNLYPNSQSENTGTAQTPVWKYASPVSNKTGAASDSQTNAKVVSGKIYVNNGFWDTYRTVWPLYSLLYPDVAEELVDGFVQQYRDGGWIARWSSPGYADLMTGTSSDSSFAEAYVSGALPTDLALEAYDAAVKNATVLPENNAVGRKGLDTSTFLGYTSTDTHESVSWGLEGLINDYAIGQMAGKLAKDKDTPASRVKQLKEESKYFEKRAEDYVNLFDEKIDFFQGRTASGAFAKTPEEYNPEQWGGDYTETNGWNFAFHAPFDVDGLSALYGGTDDLLNKLDTFFATPETAWSSQIHEAYEARDVRLGQLGMSNQVSHHIPYMYAGAGDPSKTQAIVREITQRLFVGSDIGQGYPGDEDNGEMSAWYIFSALGVYPLSLASGEYTIGSPVFDKTTVHLAGGDLVIDAKNNSTDNVYVQSADFDGKAITSASIDTSLLRGGGTLTFQMGDEASTWGDSTAPDDSTRTPYVDSTTSTTGSVSSSDDSDLTNLVDNNSRSAVAFSTEKPTITWESSSGPTAIASYTLTNGSDGASPKAWTLAGSNDGETWTPVDERTNQSFAWKTQTRPFEVASPTLYSRYRIAITATDTGAAPKLAEIELLADTMQQSDEFALYPLKKLKTTVNTEFTGDYATLTGGTSSDFGDYTATVDFFDGEGPVTAELGKSSLGGLAISAPHTWDKAGTYNARVTVGEGDLQDSTIVAITVSRDDSLEAAFNTACTTVLGTPANCDGLGYGFDRASLAANGFEQGATGTVPGTELTFDLPEVAPGKPDNATTKGQVIRLHTGAGATKISIIGTANEGEQHATAVLTFDDGTTQDVAIDFGDWVGGAASPKFGNIVVGKSTRRLAGTGVGDNQTAAIYATAPVALPEGKTPVTLTLPNEAGSLGDGLVHVFAIASDGERAATEPLEITAADLGTVDLGDTLETELATVTGGDPLEAGYVTTVNWGDETPVDDGVVTETESGATVSGSHLYTMAGTYDVTVTVDDGERSVSTTTAVTVAVSNYQPTLSVTNNPVAPGATVKLTGEGFKKNESVTVTLSSEPVVQTTVTADADGSITASVTVPADAADGTYPVSAIGAASKVAASSEVTVETPLLVSTVALELSDSAIVLGDSVTATATVTAGALGSVEFRDGTTPLAVVPLTNGTAVLKLDALTSGNHSITAVYSGSEVYLGSTSAAASVSVSKGAVTMSAPIFSKTSQVYGSASVASVATRVIGATSGTVKFISGSVTLATGKVVKSGSIYRVLVALPKTLKVGKYGSVVASFEETPTSAAATSEPSKTTFTVKKAATSKVTISGKKFTKNTRPKVTVTVATLNNGARPVGTIAIYASGKKVGTVGLTAANKGTRSFTLPNKVKSYVTVYATFLPSSPSTVESKTSAKVKLTKK